MLVILAATLQMVTALTVGLLIGNLVIVAIAGTLFYFMVKALARIQMPERAPTGIAREGSSLSVGEGGIIHWRLAHTATPQWTATADRVWHYTAYSAVNCTVAARVRSSVVLSGSPLGLATKSR